MHGVAHHFLKSTDSSQKGKKKGERCSSSLRKVKQQLLFAIRDSTSGKLTSVHGAGMQYYN